MSIYDTLQMSLEFSGRHQDALAWNSRKKIAIGAARGLRYLHEECRVGCIVHRDMRPNNILITHDFEPLVQNLPSEFYFRSCWEMVLRNWIWFLVDLTIYLQGGRLWSRAVATRWRDRSWNSSDWNIGVIFTFRTAFVMYRCRSKNSGKGAMQNEGGGNSPWGRQTTVVCHPPRFDIVH